MIHLKCLFRRHDYKYYKDPSLSYDAKVCQKCHVFRVYELIDNIEFVVATNKDESGLGLNLLRFIMKHSKDEQKHD